jgi:hypothetical protein
MRLTGYRVLLVPELQSARGGTCRGFPGMDRSLIMSAIVIFAMAG